MPKIVDHEKQRKRVAEAALRVIRKDGLEHATVRKIAEETGLSVGSMRHYFSSQAQLFSFVMQLFLDRIEERIAGIDFSGPPLDAVKRLLMQFIPMDEERRMEMEVWLSFVTKALYYPELKALSGEMYDGLKGACQQAVDALYHYRLARPGLNAEIEVERLYALVDGLAIHCLMRPDEMPAERISILLEHHLNTLCTEE
ncbi:TetR/AcrR family transcriptional regulator [Paenibacillus spongiae]|uniref:TetR family transcriptional regulator n=1 Tax=Paenibacillus spongiae TaxID=2909671 RepID=A0ABY5SCN3_9BACL|nr:TetR/AcrR family transcriptional regulator [Paenibacillus spongiae]UVI31298.1 TetR family transcriptional regulator [Paenibacillus spongiae]